MKIHSNDRRKRRSHSFLAVFLVFAFAIAIYTEVPLYLTSTFFVPAFFIVFSLPVMMVYNRKSVRWPDLTYFLGVIIVLLASALCSPGLGYVGHKLTGVLQTSVSVFAGMMLFMTMKEIPQQKLKSLFSWLTVMLFIGVVAELLGFLRGVSDAFRNLAYSQGGYHIYAATARDIGLAGFRRPSFFVSEPSLVAIGFFVFSCSWFALSNRSKTLFLLTLMHLLMLFMVRSPIILISLAVMVIIFLLAGQSKTLYRRVFVGLVFVVFLTSYLVVANPLGSRVSESLEGASSFEKSSENIRMVFPYITMKDVLVSSPLWGVGISGKEVIESFASLPFDLSTILGNNNFAAMFTYLGILGSALFCTVQYRYFRWALPMKQVIILTVFALAFSQTNGGFETPRFWGYLFLFAGALRKSCVENTPRASFKIKRRVCPV